MDLQLLDKIRDHYKFLTPLILETAQTKGPSKWTYPYCDINWVANFSPIEKQAWEAIRIFGRAPFYPQYPVRNYFVDFGNPYMKIAIECDGKEFHQDKHRDDKRDANLLSDLWMVFRISGADCNQLVSDDYWERHLLNKYDRVDVLKEFYDRTIEGLLKSLAVRYFGYTGYDDKEEDLFIDECLKKRISIQPSWA